MKKTSAAFGIAAAFGLVASVGAQTTTSTTTPQTTAMNRDSRDLMVTGCLARSADGSYLLTNAKLDNDMSHSGTMGTSGTTAGTTSATTAGSSTTSGTTATSMPGAATAGMSPMNSWSLQGGTDLDKHVGHKVQITGRAVPAGASGSTTATTSTTGSTTTATTSTTGSTTTATTADDQHKMMNRATQKLDVKALKMIASSCP